MKKAIDFILIFLLAFFIASFFTNDDGTKNTGKFLVHPTKSTYKIPAIPSLNFENYTGKDVQFDNCEAISVRSDGEVLQNQENWCVTVLVPTWETVNASLPIDQKTFENLWNYTVDVNIAEKEYTVQFETKHRGTIWQLFVYLFYAPIYNLMAYILSHVWYSLGFAIIILTIIVRILLIYPQHKMMVNQKRMQNIQPKIQEIQEKNKWNQAVIGQELLALYKNEGVNPFGACGLLIIQMPILIVIYNVIQSINSQSNSFYVYDFLSYFQIDKINPFFYNINLLESGGIVGLVLALVVWILQYFQIKLSLAKNKKVSSKWEVLEKKKNSNDLNSMMPDPEMMNKFMLYGMPSMVAVFTFFFLAGLWIYWGMTTIFMIFQQIFINKILKKSS